jgi:L-alanine-DL-glutamate epimerase-like enolase superfamily enzyme
VAAVVVAEIQQDGISGRGECVPYSRYGETVSGVADQIRMQNSRIAAGMDRVELQSTLAAGAARNAIDCALWDLEAKLLGRRAWKLANIEEPPPLVTAETVSIDTPAAMAETAARLSDRHLLKIKLGRENVIERVRAVRSAAPDCRLIVDPNESWDLDTLKQTCGALADLGVSMIEQPLPSMQDAGLSALSLPVPLCADESCHTEADLPALSGHYQMINIKLDKTGGLTGALRLATNAVDAGFTVMVGCMVSTSLSIAPATLLGSFATFVDLDGPLWLANDRQPELRFDKGCVYPPEPALWG